MRRAAVLTALAAFAAAPGARAVTPAQAQALPLPDLAHLVLGEAGAVMVDVDRPAWPTCVGFCAPPTPEQIREQEGPPALRSGMSFYQRATPSDIGTVWAGLCETQVVKVDYDDAGGVRAITTHRQYGAPSGMRLIPKPDRGNAATVEHSAQACAAAHDVKSFFYADGSDSAFFGLIAFQLLADAVKTKRPLPFTFDCDIFNDKHCTATPGELIGLQPGAIRQVDHCETAGRPKATDADHACYQFQLHGPGEQAIVELADIYGEPRLVRVSYSNQLVVY